MSDQEEKKSTGSNDRASPREPLFALFSETALISHTIDLTAPRTTALEMARASDLEWSSRPSLGKLLEAIPIPTLLIDRSHRILFVNKALSGVHEDYLNISGSRFSSLFPSPKKAEMAEAMAEKVFVERRPLHLEGLLQINDAFMWGRMNICAVRIKDERLLLALVENLSNEKSQSITNEKYRNLVNRLPTAVVEFSLQEPLLPGVSQPEGFAALRRARVASWNPALREIHPDLDPEDLKSSRLEDLFPFPEEILAFLRQWSAGHQPLHSYESRETGKAGETRYLDNTLLGNVTEGKLLGCWGMRRDLTSQRRLEEQLLQSQKMEAIGLLANGIAHDMNNLLTPILFGSDVLLQQLDRDGWVAVTFLRETLGRIKHNCNRASEIVGQLLTFSRKEDSEKIPVDLHVGVNHVLEILRRRADVISDIEIHNRIPAGIPTIRANPTQIELVMLNLGINACDAMPSGGELSFSAQVVDRTGPRKGDISQEGLYVQVTVTDTGVGMDPAVLARIFDPFFTTKQIGKGTGLGLSTVHGIVKNHGGHIRVYSTPGKGTTFHLLLPMALTDEERPSVVQTESTLRTCRILLVDDEKSVLEALSEGLRAFGFQVVTASSGQEALSLWHDDVDLVITDLVMPGMSGVDLITQVRSRSASVKIILVTGYSIEPDDGVHNLGQGVARLTKPLTLRSLLDAMESLVGEELVS
ncbi:MAG: ATP-binding protein [Thermodesulfobacteriota bacterium]